MDPDQWFRLWLAVGQGAIGGAVTLIGGYLGYRLAGRTERNMHKAEALRELDDQFASLEAIISRHIVARPRSSRAECLSEVSIEWLGSLTRTAIEWGSETAVLSMEFEVELLTAQLSPQLSESDDPGDFMDDPADLIDGFFGIVRRIRAELLQWRIDGPPGRIELRKRRRRARQDLEVVRRRGGKLAAEAISQALKSPPD